MLDLVPVLCSLRGLLITAFSVSLLLNKQTFIILHCGPVGDYFIINCNRLAPTWSLSSCHYQDLPRKSVAFFHPCLCGLLPPTKQVFLKNPCMASLVSARLALIWPSSVSGSGGSRPDRIHKFLARGPGCNLEARVCLQALSFTQAFSAHAKLI